MINHISSSLMMPVLGYPESEWLVGLAASLACLLRYCRNVRPTWVKFNSKDTKKSCVVCEGF